LPLADPVEGGFEFVHEFGHGGEAEHGARTLDCVQRPERGIDEILVGRVLLQIEQARFKLVEQLARFLAEGLGGIGDVHAPVTFLMMASNWSCLNGLTIQPVAPASLAWRLSSSSDSVVSRMIGTPLLAGCWRYFRMNSMPLRTGMLRSVRTAWTLFAMALS